MSYLVAQKPLGIEQVGAEYGHKPSTDGNFSPGIVILFFVAISICCLILFNSNV